MSPVKRARLYLRDSVPAVARTEQQKTVGRLQALKRVGVIDDLVVENWPSRVTNGTPETVPALAAYEGFTHWAHSHGASMRPAFDCHECDSLYTGTHFTSTVFPVMCLAVYEDDQLVTVYPHARRGRPTTVSDGIAILESARPLAQPQRPGKRDTSARG